MATLTVESILRAEMALREQGIQPPYALRATAASMRALLLSAAGEGDGVKLTGASEFANVGLTLGPGERVVARVGDTYLVVDR